MKTMPGLLAKAKALKEEGLNALVWSGGYKTPPATINDSISTDIMFVDEIVGVGEIAIADERSTEPTPQELARIVSEAHNSGMLSQKCGLTHFHVGNKEQRLKILFDLVSNFGVSADWLYPTHITRSVDLMREAIELSKRGAYVDIDTVEEDLVKQLQIYFENNGWPQKLTVSSDASKTAPQNLFDQIGECVRQCRFPLEQVLAFVTSNTADALKLKDKGRIVEGNIADILVIKRDDFQLRDVFSKANHLLKDGELNFKERFLKKSNREIKLDGEKRHSSSARQQRKEPEDNEHKLYNGVEKIDTGNNTSKGKNEVHPSQYDRGGDRHPERRPAGAVELDLHDRRPRGRDLRVGHGLGLRHRERQHRHQRRRDRRGLRR
jgi:beta-aspartyl-dipeptidase (metallo-type)